MHIQGETELPGKFDVIRIDLQPSEQYKSVSAHATLLRYDVVEVHATVATFVRESCVYALLVGIDTEGVGSIMF